MSEESRNAPGAQHASLLHRQHQASRAIAAAGDEAAVGQALMDFAASGDVHAARVLLFSDTVDGQPTTMETREGWTVDDRPTQPYGSRFPLDNYPLLEFLDASTAVVCENVETDARANEPVRQLMALSGVGSFVFIPLTAGRRDLESDQHAGLDQVWLGAVFIGRNSPSTYDEELIYAWWTLAGQAASAIENARLFASLQHAHQEQQRRSEELEGLHETLLDLTQEQHDLDTVLEIISRRIMTLLDADGGGVWLWQAEDQELELVVTFQVGDVELTGRRLKPGEGLTGSAFVEEKIQVIDDYPAWAGRASTFDDAPFFAAMAVPMFWQNQVVGALVATRSQQGYVFSTREQRLAQLLTDQTATGIQNARLFAQTQAVLAETESIYEASRRLTTAKNLQEMLAAVAKAAPVPAINRVVFWMIERDAQGKESAIVSAANWHSGEGTSPLPVGTRVPLDEFPAIQWVINTEPTFSRDTQQDESIDAATRETFQRQNARAVALLPLWLDDRQLGTLMLVGDEPHYFTESEIRPYRSLAGQMSVRVENRRLLEQTQISEARFRDVALSGGNWVWETNARGRYIYCSEQVIDVLGYTSEEIIGRSPWSFVHPEDADRAIQVVAELAAAKQPIVDLESRAVTKDGRVVTLLTNGVPILDENGDLLGYRGVVKDISAQREAQAERERLLAALERRSAQLQAAAEVSRAASSTLDPDELIQQVVDLAQERFGLYYAGLFMVEQTAEAGEWAMLKAGTQEAGRKMVGQGHKLQVGGESMIGWCTANKQARISLDVGEEAVRFDNPHLPETRSEMALPLISGGQAIGAMTIQSAQAAAFSEEDIATLQTMADQLAAAIDNARLYGAAQARAQREQRIRAITDRVRRGADREAIMRITLEELGQMLGASRSVIRLGAPGQLGSAYEPVERPGEGD